LITPTNPPTRIPTATAVVVDHPALIPKAVITPVRAIVDPTDRPIPPLMMTMVMPIAPTETMTVCARTVRRFLRERYFSGAPIRIAKITITSSRPRTGASRFNQLRAIPDPEVVQPLVVSATMEEEFRV